MARRIPLRHVAAVCLAGALGPGAPVPAAAEGPPATIAAPAPAPAAAPVPAAAASAAEIAAFRVEVLALEQAWHQGDPDAWAGLSRLNEAANADRFVQLPERALPNLAFGRIYHSLDNYPEAARMLTYVVAFADSLGLEKHPDQIDAMARLGEIRYRQNRYLDAEALLRRVLDHAADDPALHEPVVRAAYYLSKMMYENGMPGTRAALDRAIALMAQDPARQPVNFAHLLYLAANMAQGAEDWTAARETAEKLMALVRETEAITPLDRAQYTGYFGLLLTQMGEVDEGYPYLRERLDYYISTGKAHGLAYEAYQQLAYNLFARGERAEARAVLEDGIALMRGVKPPDDFPWYTLGVFLRDTGYLSNALGEPARAQRDFREAYAALRMIHPASHPDLRQIAAEITPAWTDRLTFAFRNEIDLAGSGAALPLDRDTAGLLHWFLEGRYAQIGPALDAAADRDDAAWLVNNALYQALSGRIEVALAEAGAAAAAAPGDAVLARAAAFARAIALVWGVNPFPEQSRAALAALDALGEMPPGQAAFREALHIYGAGETGDHRAAAARLADWRARWLDDPAADPFAVFAAMLTAEEAFRLLPQDEARSLSAAVRSRLTRQPELVFASNYVEFTALYGDYEAAQRDDVLPALARIKRATQEMVAEHHTVQVTMNHAYALVLDQRGRLDEAVRAIETAIDLYQRNPHPSDAALAILLDQRANLAQRQGSTEDAIIFSRRAVDLVDRPGGKATTKLDIYSTYTYALQEFGETDLVLATARRLVADASFMAELAPRQRAGARNMLARALVNSGQIEAGLAVYDEVLVELSYDRADEAQDLSVFQFDRGIAHLRRGAFGPAYRDIAQANAIVYRLIDRQAQAARSGRAVNDYFAPARARAEAQAGWAYARTLEAGRP